MAIPIENIYYLLCYSWDKLDEKDRVKVSTEETTQLIDLFAKILINGTKVLLKRGIDRSYIEVSEEIPGVKGKIDFAQTIKKNLLIRQRTVCTFDVFAENILVNQILVTTIKQLTRTKGLDFNLRKELLGLQKMFYGIDDIKLSISLFSRVKLNRNNRFYGFLMNVCQILYENMLPSEQQGSYHFSDFTRDEKKMNKLFESFVRNFYRREQKRYNIVGREVIRWKFNGSDEAANFLPQMETDITLQNDTEKIIIDAKYYSETMATYYDKQRIKSNNLYQLFSYLLNQEKGDAKTRNATGILLYPTIEKDYDLHYRYANHDIQIRTLNLNTGWKNIEQRLLEII